VDLHAVCARCSRDTPKASGVECGLWFFFFLSEVWTVTLAAAEGRAGLLSLSGDVFGLATMSLNGLDLLRLCDE
jgi:hypothetical protein